MKITNISDHVVDAKVDGQERRLSPQESVEGNIENIQEIRRDVRIGQILNG